ncbi:DapH/DapD/GlmU-related protein [Mucilaginibacter sp. McL0603]|uniref:DapH/DapD/GlmU-related protein n=1 Tax=Mucilaginibacter sp. McL0603 TaxID=3415670 RepID=UPI003CF4B0D1
MHKLDGASTHPAFYLRNTPLLKKYSNQDEFTTAKQTLIGHDVWIGENAIVLDGVNIGTGAVVAAGAVVTKDVAPYTIVGGVPAKIIKTRFSGSEIDCILNSKWWDKNEEWLIENYKSFNDISDFIKLVNGKLS